jgi:integral membrane protein
MIILNFAINKALRTVLWLFIFYFYTSNLIFMLKFFKIIAILEGVSYLVLFSNMLIVKPTNLVLYKTLLFPIGMAHGVLFITYIILAVLLKFKENWDFKKFGIIGLASIIPFGTFYMEKKYLKNV